MGLGELFHLRSWNLFKSRKNYEEPNNTNGYSSFNYYTRPDRYYTTNGNNEQSLLMSALNKIAVEVANVPIYHIRKDRYDGTFADFINDSINERLNMNANIDQSGSSLIQSAVLSMFDEGCVAIVPVDTNSDINESNNFDIYELRVGKIVTWYPKDIKVELYDSFDGIIKSVIVPKNKVAIIENPFYSIMNEPNSTFKRLKRKLALLDKNDEDSNNGKLDLIIQLPYVIKSEARKKQAEERRKDIEDQLNGSKYGIAYTDGTERITQLNRAVENNMLSQVTYLLTTFYNQMGISESVFNGTANENELQNYYRTTINPILSAFCKEFEIKFLTKTARTQGQGFAYFRDPLKNTTPSSFATISDTLIRNMIVSSNEVRSLMGRMPVDTPEADALSNPNTSSASSYDDGGYLDDEYENYDEGGYDNGY